MLGRLNVTDDVLSQTEVTEIPKFCPRCRRDARPDTTLCEACGERLIEQGYCSVCEHFWRLPARSLCPKHEIELEESPPPAEFSAAGVDAERWVTVGTFSDAMKVEALRIRLEAEGIPTFLEGARMGSPAMYTVATGGVKLQVPQALVPDARVLLSQSWSAVVEPGDDLDDAWDELAPQPGASMDAVVEITLLVLVVGPVLLALFAWLTHR